MKKGVKKAVAAGIAFTALGAVIPTSLPGSELIIDRAYAEATNNNKLTDLRLETSGGSTIKIYYDDDYKSKDKVDTKDIKEDTQYYAKTSSKSIRLDDVSGVDDEYVRIFDSTSSSTKGVKVGKKFSLSSGTNKITIRVYKEKPDDNVKYKEDDNKLADYTIKIKYTGSDEDDDDDNDDDKIYLKKLEVTNRNEDDIKLSPEFDKKTNNYNVEVKKDTNYVVVTAKPEDDDDDDVKTKINGTTVDDDDDWEKKVYLNEGKNEVEVRVKNDDDDLLRVYTLYIYRGVKAPATTSTDDNKNENNKQQNTTTVVAGQPNQWIGNGVVWKRTNNKGELITNTWFYDNIYCQNYYFDKDGHMATGWKQIDGKWYYFSNGGVKQTGWVPASGKWYYMDSQGVMQTGWINVGGNFYYLNPDKIGQGAMQTGWTKIMGSWYYFDQSGRMLSNTTIDGCRLGVNGAMV